MTHTLTLTSPLVRAVWTSSRSSLPLLVPLGFQRSAEETETLAHGTMTSGADDAPRLAALRADSREVMEHRLLEAMDRPAVAAAVVLGERSAAGRVMALFHGREGRRSYDRVRIVGPGMPWEPLHLAPPPTEAERERWSRTLGALGASAWQRLRGLHVALLGCGRTGSVMALGLARWPVGRLTLIDGDRVEAHNLGEMAGLGASHLGMTKVEALRQVCIDLGLRPDQVVTAIPTADDTLAALLAARTADLLVCAVDHPLGRMVAAVVATLYARPLLDLGTGILPDENGRRLGADVRLVLPGRCLSCFGGVAGWPEVRDARRRHESLANVPWHVQRVGSLASLNGLAANLGLRLIEEVAQEGPADSRWVSLDLSTPTRWILDSTQPALGHDCRLCRWTGRGDTSLKDLGYLLNEVA